MDKIRFSSTNKTRLHEKLEGLMEQLKAKAVDIRNELRNEELQARKKIRDEVALWLKNVSDIEEQVQSIGTEVAKVGSLRDNWQLSYKLEEKVECVEKLLKCEFSRGICLDDFKSEGLELVTQKMEGCTPSRVQDAVWSCFERGKWRVAIFGIGGVGKTTLAMHINNEILDQKRLFERVYYVTVSRDTSVHKLQRDIAEAFELRLNYEDESKRAAELRMALAKREKSLLILDDVWEDITMEEVGVSVEGDGCRLLITTRDRGVCRKMKCCPVQMKPLSTDESLDLFKKQLDNFETLLDEVKDIAASVAKECDGLPLGIVTMARSMRGETDVPVWRDALRELRNPCSSSHDMENKVYRILKYSYDRLKKEKHRKCFLYCALYPEDYKIERKELIRHFIAMGLLDGTNRKESIDEGHALLNVLENASLLECAEDFWNKVRKCVKMHDLVRDMAIRILGSTAMVIEHKNLEEIFGKEERVYKDLKWVSLFDNRMDNIEGLMPDCPNISVLLYRDGVIETISDSFFVKMISLKVLDLSYIEVKVLPASVSDLCNLTSLMLRGCVLLRFIPSLAKLTKLRQLDLKGCESMRELPASVSDLCNLTSLMLRGCEKLHFIPSLAKLTKLRQLDLKGCECMSELPEGMEELASLQHLNLQWTTIKSLHTGVIKKLLNLERFLGNHIGVIVPPEELMGLKHMKNLSLVHFEDVSEFSRCVGFGCFNQLETYHVSIGHSLSTINYGGDPYVLDDTELIKEICWNGGSREEYFLVPQNVIRLEFRDCSFGGGSLLGHLPSLGDVTSDLDLCWNGCWNDYDCECECIIPEWWTKPLLHIRQLTLAYLYEFSGLIREEVVYPCISFSGLKVLEIYYCQKLKKLWMLNLDLPNLEEIIIANCKQMEEIFATEKGGIVELPRLHSLKLMGLSELRSIWSNCEVDDEAGDDQIHLPKLEELLLDDVPELRSISRKTVVCNSLRCVSIKSSLSKIQQKMDNCPISVPSLSAIGPDLPKLSAYEMPRGWWESLQWNDPATLSNFRHLGCFSYHWNLSEPDFIKQYARAFHFYRGGIF